MANTGKKIVLTLKQVSDPGGVPTGVTKPNTIGDPDYIAPYTDLTVCSVTSDMTCPDLAVSGGVGTVEFEINVPGSVLLNATIAKVKVKLMASDDTTEITNKIIVLPFTPSPNYKYDSFISLSAATLKIQVDYLNSSDVAVKNCTYPFNITVT